MIKIENVVLPSAEQWEAVIRGMRNPMNSWDLSDSEITFNDDPAVLEKEMKKMKKFLVSMDVYPQFFMGDADHVLAQKLADGGSVHAKYRRMIPVYLDITAPLYFWKEFDTYKVGTVANSCSTMHKIAAKEFTLDDFSCEHLTQRSLKRVEDVIDELNFWREIYLNGGCVYDDFGNFTCYPKNNKYIWWQMIQLLPSSYNQRRTIFLSYEVLYHMYNDRKDHKLDEWRNFCDWIKTLPYSELVIKEKTK